MAKKDPRIDAYIANSAPFAKPILKYIRKAVHTGCPDVEETLKWGFPHFLHQGILCGMAAFKAHCAFGFWKGSLIPGKDKGLKTGTSFNHFGHLGSLKDLPNEKTLIRYVKAAVKLNEAGTKSPTRGKRVKDRLSG